MATEFLLAQSIRVDTLISDLLKVFPLRDDGSKNIERVYYDTFDSRLFRKNLRLILEKDSERQLIMLRPLKNPVSQRIAEVRNIPKFASEFESTILQEKLIPIAGIRALIHQVTIKIKVHQLRYLDKDEKTCLYIFIENPRALAAGDHYRNMGKRIWLLPVKGYTSSVKKIEKYLRKKYDISAVDKDQFLSAMEILGKQPVVYSSRLKLKLNPNNVASTAVSKALLTLFHTMEVNERGIIEDIDSEFLHDFRVAVRRTRSALSQMKHTLPQEVVDQYREEFGWIGSITGPARDWDVYLLMFAEYKSQLPADIALQLEPLKVFLQNKRDEAYQILASQLKSDRYRKLKSDWQKYLQAPVNLSGLESNAEKPAKEVVSARIWKIYRRVIKEGALITDKTPYRELHKLRISCKKLRYLLEIFQNFYPAKKIKPLIKCLKDLQNNLGDYCDYHIQIESFKKFEDQIKQEIGLSSESEMAIDCLVNVIVDKQEKSRSVIGEKFHQFSRDKYVRLFKDLFKNN